MSTNYYLQGDSIFTSHVAILNINYSSQIDIFLGKNCYWHVGCFKFSNEAVIITAGLTQYRII